MLILIKRMLCEHPEIGDHWESARVHQERGISEYPHLWQITRSEDQEIQTDILLGLLQGTWQVIW